MKVCDNFFILLTNKQMEVKIVLLLELVLGSCLDDRNCSWEAKQTHKT